jgi:hypothetical protein
MINLRKGCSIIKTNIIHDSGDSDTNFGPETGYPEEYSRDSPQSLPEIAERVSQIKLLPSTCLPIHYSLIILSFDAMNC